MTNLAISSLFFFHLFWCLLSGKPKKDCSLDLGPLTLQAFMDKDQWVWMSKVMLQWGVYLLIVFCFLKHYVVCVFLVCLRETGEAKQPKTMMLYSFRQSSCLKLTETSVLHVKVWEKDLNSDPQNMLQGLFIFQSFWKRSWRERGNMG